MASRCRGGRPFDFRYSFTPLIISAFMVEVEITLSRYAAVRPEADGGAVFFEQDNTKRKPATR